MFFKDFTSHIVQIKPVKFPSEAVDERFIFTSHIVQIKPLTCEDLEMWQQATLHPT